MSHEKSITVSQKKPKGGNEVVGSIFGESTRRASGRRRIETIYSRDALLPTRNIKKKKK